jgi:hypothetical protein
MRTRSRVTAILLLLLWASSAWAGVAFDNKGSATAITNTTITTPAFTIAAGATVIAVGASLQHATADYTAVSWSLGSGTVTKVKVLRDHTLSTPDSYTTVWCINAPTTGSGTVTATSDTSVPLQLNAASFTGSDTTTPCPAANAQTSASEATSVTVTPTGLGANDASYGAAGSNIGNNPLGCTTALQTDSNTAENQQTGYALGTTGVVCTWDLANGHNTTFVAVRIQAPSGAAVKFRRTLNPFGARAGSRPWGAQ